MLKNVVFATFKLISKMFLFQALVLFTSFQ